jgi:septum formation protein
MRVQRNSPLIPTRVRSARWILASASPRRARILESLGVAHKVRVPQVDERIAQVEEPGAAAKRLARAKAVCVAARGGSAVLAADTVVVVDDRILGKPRSRIDAVRMLQRLSGREHEVVTGVCLRFRGRTFVGCERTRVRFARLTRADAQWYVRTGEPMDKAGAYHVDGIGALFVTAIHGSPSNVEGLPVGLVRRLARRAGLRLGPA